MGSTGRIAEQIGREARRRGHESVIAFGRHSGICSSSTHRIGGKASLLWHGIESFVADRHGLASRVSTRKFIRWIEQQNPDAIGLHNIHGYYLNYPLLFDYLRHANIPVVWTMHDCWAFTGHCAYYGRFDCYKWLEHCYECPMTGYYPKSLIDLSRQNFELKRKSFSGVKDLLIVTPSRWLGHDIKRSILSQYPVKVIHNGIDIDIFKPGSQLSTSPIVLGVANRWPSNKGFGDFMKMRALLPSRFRIVMVGVTEAQSRMLPDGIEGVPATNSVDELVSWYQRSSVFVNPTYNDNFPTANIEALACGVPVVTYQTGGSPEAVDNLTGRVVAQGDINGMAKAIQEIATIDRAKLRTDCRLRAVNHFNKDDRFSEYLDLYETMMTKS